MRWSGLTCCPTPRASRGSGRGMTPPAPSTSSTRYRPARRRCCSTTPTRPCPRTTPTSPYYPDVLPGTPVRVRAIPPAATSDFHWYVHQRYAERWPQSWDSLLRGQVEFTGNDPWQSVSKQVPTPYRAEVICRQPVRLVAVRRPGDHPPADVAGQRRARQQQPAWHRYRASTACPQRSPGSRSRPATTTRRSRTSPLRRSGCTATRTRQRGSRPARPAPWPQAARSAGTWLAPTRTSRPSPTGSPSKPGSTWTTTHPGRARRKARTSRPTTSSSCGA